MKSYPIKFIPILKHKIWGGKKLNQILNKKSDANDIGESWEISTVDNDISVIANGYYENQTLQALLDKYKEKLVGKKVYRTFKNNFPLLIKFIDANTDLSVQLHPNDKLAMQRHKSFGQSRWPPRVRAFRKTPGRSSHRNVARRYRHRSTAASPRCRGR